MTGMRKHIKDTEEKNPSSGKSMPKIGNRRPVVHTNETIYRDLDYTPATVKIKDTAEKHKTIRKSPETKMPKHILLHQDKYVRKLLGARKDPALKTVTSQERDLVQVRQSGGGWKGSKE